MPSYEPVTALVRGLAVLDAMAVDAASTIRGLHAATGIPKPTLVRILETLSFAGYVETGAGGYRLARRSSSSPERRRKPVPKAGSIAALLHDFTDRSGWQTLFATPSPGGMQATTSPLAMPFATSAAGRAFLSALSDESRARWLAADDLDPSRARVLADQLAVIRSRGYARGQSESDPGLLALAAPVTREETPCGAVVLLANRDAISMAELETRHAADLRTLANALAVLPEISAKSG